MTTNYSHKLNGFGPIYYLNLDKDIEKKQYLENHLKENNIVDYTRISSFDGKDEDLSVYLEGNIPENLTGPEIGCTISHLKAIKTWIETSDSEYAIIMEDDCSLDLCNYWNFTWKELYNNLPFDWDVVQLCTICTGQTHIRLHKKFIDDYSTCCYVINRSYAKKILGYHVIDNKFKIDQGVKPIATADHLIYNAGNTYSVPVILYNINFNNNSSITSNENSMSETIHKINYDRLTKFWAETGKDINVKDLTNYDAILGKLSSPDSQYYEFKR